MLDFNKYFLERMKILLGRGYDSFLSCLNESEQKGIFVNNHKISTENFVDIVDFRVSPIAYEKSGFYIDNLKLGKHPLHCAGAFYIQDPSAMFTVNAFEFKGNEIVLDLCASPGGKSIQIANRIPEGIIISNEIINARAQILYSNIERMGLDNVIITNDDPKNIARAYANEIDVCLVDAPCSGEGMFRRGEEVIKEWNENLPKMCSVRQLEILEQANLCLKENGCLIYSTCTYSLEENENVIRSFLAKHNYELVNIEYPFSRGVDMPEAVRLYPHEVRGEGQFVAVMKKLEKNEFLSNGHLYLKENEKFEKFLSNYLNFQPKVYDYKDFSYIVKNENLIKQGINYLTIGVRAGQDRKKYYELNHNLFSSLGSNFKNQINLDYIDQKIKKYLRGETLEIQEQNGYGAILISGCALGGYKISDGKFKNLYPKGLRIFN